VSLDRFRGGERRASAAERVAVGGSPAIPVAGGQ
jgi:hypothetical protein